MEYTQYLRHKNVIRAINLKRNAIVKKIQLSPFLSYCSLFDVKK